MCHRCCLRNSIKSLLIASHLAMITLLGSFIFHARVVAKQSNHVEVAVFVLYTAGSLLAIWLVWHERTCETKLIGLVNTAILVAWHFLTKDKNALALAQILVGTTLLAILLAALMGRYKDLGSDAHHRPPLYGLDTRDRTVLTPEPFTSLLIGCAKSKADRFKAISKNSLYEPGKY